MLERQLAQVERQSLPPPEVAEVRALMDAHLRNVEQALNFTPRPTHL